MWLRSAGRRSEYGRCVLEHARPCFAGDQRSMQMKISAGLQDSGTEAESDAENVEADLALSELSDQHEAADWREIPGISAAEASARTAQLAEARDRIQESP